MPNTIIATGSKTIIDLSDGKSLSVYLGSNRPRTQIKDVNASPATFTPNWATSPYLVITPTVYANNTFIELSNANLSVTYTRKEGNNTSPTGSQLTTGESVSGNVLTVNANKLDTASGNTLTYVASVVYNDPDTSLPINAKAEISFALVTTGLNGENGDDAKFAWISGEQVFKYTTAGGTPTPSQIVLTANVQGVTVSKWQYKNSSGNWADYPTSSDNTSINGTTLIVKPSHAVFVNDVATIQLTTSDNNISDVTSVYKVVDGTAGASVSMAFLTNESITFAAAAESAGGKVASATATCNVVAYTGTSKVTPTVGTITGAPTGMTVSKGNATNGEIPITITVSNSNLGANGPVHGQLVVPITAPVSTNLIISWNKVNTGATGSTGQNAIVFSLYAPNGTVFVNAASSETKTIKAQAYDGSTEIADANASFKWYKYSNGNWIELATTANKYNVSGSTLTVYASEVPYEASFKCEMTYQSKKYTDIITLTDKTDNYQMSIDSTGGDVFKNTRGTTVLTARLWQNGYEVDEPKSSIYTNADPTSPTPATGDYYYKYTSGSHAVKLMRYSGSAWEDVTSNATYKHTKTYTWYRRDANGDSMDSGAAFATGKAIYVTDADVTNKTVFICEAE